MPKVKGPKDGIIDAAHFDGQGLTRCENLAQTKCIVLVSIVNNSFCEGPYFLCTLRDALKKFGFVAILIVDAPHRHNLQFADNNIADSDQSLIERAKELGSCWFLRNESAFFSLFSEEPLLQKQLQDDLVDNKISSINERAETYAKRFKIFRWDAWVAQLRICSEGLLSHSRFNDAVAATASLHVRKKTKKESNEYQSMIVASQRYLVEETVGIVPAALKLQYHFIAYPGDIIAPIREAIDYLRSTDISYQNLEWLHINFTRASFGKNTVQADVDNCQPHVPSVVSFLNSDSVFSSVQTKQCTFLMHCFYLALCNNRDYFNTVQEARSDEKLQKVADDFLLFAKKQDQEKLPAIGDRNINVTHYKT